MVKHNTQGFFAALGENIAKTRKDLDMTQEDLGSAVGISQQSVVKYERAERRIPLPVLVKMAAVFQCSLEDLLPSENPKPRKRGPLSKLERTWEKVRNLPEDKKKLLVEMVETWVK